VCVCISKHVTFQEITSIQAVSPADLEVPVHVHLLQQRLAEDREQFGAAFANAVATDRLDKLHVVLVHNVQHPVGPAITPVRDVRTSASLQC